MCVPTDPTIQAIAHTRIRYGRWMDEWWKCLIAPTRFPWLSILPVLIRKTSPPHASSLASVMLAGIHKSVSIWS